jgi:hypothetical protein
MSAVQVRPFRRSDRDQLTQLTQLVNAHAEAVVPGMSASVNTVLSSLERRPGEFIEDPWVSERVTLVAEQAGRVAARDAGEICWLLFWPQAPAGNPCWPGATAAAEALMAACAAQFGRWGVSASSRAANCRSPACTGSRSSGRTSRASTSGPGSATPGRPRWSTWPGSRICRTQPACRSKG